MAKHNVVAFMRDVRGRERVHVWEKFAGRVETTGRYEFAVCAQCGTLRHRHWDVDSYGLDASMVEEFREAGGIWLDTDRGCPRITKA